MVNRDNMIQNLTTFLKDRDRHGVLQLQAMFEFRYPVLFGNDSFLIEQINFPKVDTNVGNVYLDGYKIPVHSTAQFDNEISFTMYVDERDFKYDGRYFSVFRTLLDPTHRLYGNDNYITQLITDALQSENSTRNAKIIPLSGKYINDEKQRDTEEMDKTIVLYNALIKSIVLSGGFSYNSQALAKFDVVMTYSFMDHNLALDFDWSHTYER